MKIKEYLYYCNEINELLSCYMKQEEVKLADTSNINFSKGKIEEVLVSLFCPKEFHVYEYIGEV